MPSDPTPDSVAAALTRLARDDSGRILSLLASRFGDLELADDAVQDALIEAAEQWPHRGIPQNPPGWLHTVAKRRAIDRLRRDAAEQRRLERSQRDVVERRVASDAGGRHMIDDDSSLASSEADERLQLMLLCCHPAIGPDAQVALTLRLVGGLTTAEIAAASLVPEATLAQRIVRAKQKIKMANIPMSMPESINSRLGALCSVLYLIFNEGYLSSSESRAAVRVDLAEEAIRLTRVTRHLVAAAAESDAAVPDPLMAQDGNAEVEGLLALQLFQWARLGTRLDGRGDLVLLEDQDRTKWDRHAIAEANNLLRTAMQRFQPGPYQLQAVIAGHHANARTAADTDWPTIAGLYGQLVAVSPSPITELNRAVAVAMADGPVVGLAMVDAISGLDDYHLLHATRGELLFRAGDATAAFAAFDEARRHARHPAERRHLERRRAAVSRL